MSQNNEEQPDPASSTMMFRKFVDSNDEPTSTPPRPPVTPYVLAAVGVVLAIGIVVTVVITWS